MLKTGKNLLSVLLATTIVLSSAAIGFAGTAPAGAAAALPEAVCGKSIITTITSVEEAAAVFAEDKSDSKAANTADDGCLTDCHGQCGYTPGIAIPGNMGTRVFQLDENGNRKYDENGNALTTWPISIDTDYALKTIALPLAKSVLTQRDNGLSAAVGQVMETLLKPYAIGPDGMPLNVEAETYPHSLAFCTQSEKDFINGALPVQPLSQIIGEDHVYFLAYNTSGNHLTAVNDLYDMIQRVKRETGHDKVNILAASLGATVFMGLMEYYPEVYKDLNKVCLVVPAYDGTSLIGDTLTNNMSYEDEMLYRDLLPSLLGSNIIPGASTGYISYLGNILMRMLPEDVLRAVLDAAYRNLTGLMARCTTMWALCPSSDYSEACARWLNDPGAAEIKRQVALYHQAQADAKDNFLDFAAKGVRFYSIVDYDVTLYTIGRGWKQYNSDGTIPLYSTSMGATCGYVNTPLPAGYVQQNTHCSDPSHNHISPDGIVDASTGLFPDTTWYFRWQRHEQSPGNDVIIKLVTEAATTDNITTVFSDPRFPQFNEGRVVWGFTYDIERAKAIDQSTLSPGDAAELNAAIEQAEAVMNTTIIDTAAYQAARDRFYGILIKIGFIPAPEDSTAADLATVLLRFISNTLYTCFGGRGFYDIMR